MASNDTGQKPVLVESAPTVSTTSVQTGRRLSDSKPTTFSEKVRYELQFIRGRGAFEISIVFVVILIAFSIISLVSPKAFPFLSATNLSGVITQSVPQLAIFAVAVGILMVAGEFDLSLGYAITFNAIMFVRFADSFGAWGGIIAAIASGMLIALINACIVVFTKIPSFIATLGMGFFWGGASIWVNGANSAEVPKDIQADDSWFSFVFSHNFGFFRSQFIWLIVIGVIAWFFLHRHKYGNHIFAVGGNASAARAISIKPGAVKIMAWLIYGGLVGLGSVMYVARIPSVQPGGNATADFTLMAVAAAVVGGTSLLGGRGSVIGMIVGAALIQVIENGLILAKAPGFYLQLFVGITIVIAAIFNRFMEGKAS